jgi:hypothetical protein
VYGLSALILLNVGFAMFITDENADGVPDLDKTWQLAYAAFECGSTLVFTAEFLGRLWCCVEAPGTCTRRIAPCCASHPQSLAPSAAHPAARPHAPTLLHSPPT